MLVPQKTVIVGAGPVGSLAALFAAQRGHEVEVYELRPGKATFVPKSITSYLVYSLGTLTPTASHR
jgi:kynurenine 3-monooxygenase